MSSEPFQEWIEGHSSDQWRWYIKRLAANDTLATGSHQAGPYVPKKVFFSLFPSLNVAGAGNPTTTIPSRIDSHSIPERQVRAAWYNQKTRNECHITGWGGASSPVLDPESTGSVCVFAFNQSDGKDAEGCDIWLCSSEEEEFLEERSGFVEPGIPLFLVGGRAQSTAESASEVLRDCWLNAKTMPPEWGNKFPSGAEIVAHCVELRSLKDMAVDDRLLSRRNCEYEIFRSVEQISVLPRIQKGFQTISEFIDYSNAVSNRRKSRSGRSLELQLKEIFQEEGVRFSHGEISEGNKKPDFLFPSAAAYRANSPPLSMLAAKTTCKDRWRQILNEADRIPAKHLITLQEGLSVNQFSEMRSAGVTLVVPRGIQKSYPSQIRSELLSLRNFIEKLPSA